MDSLIPQLCAVAVVLVLTLLVLLICREIVCWYWKINEGIGTLLRIEQHLAILSTQARAQSQGFARQPQQPSAEQPYQMPPTG